MERTRIDAYIDSLKRASGKSGFDILSYLVVHDMIFNEERFSSVWEAIVETIKFCTEYEEETKYKLNKVSLAVCLINNLRKNGIILIDFMNTSNDYLVKNMYNILHENRNGSSKIHELIGAIKNKEFERIERLSEEFKDLPF